MSIQLSATAAKEIQSIIKDQDLPTEKTRLRVGVKGGGCSGFSYMLDLTEEDPTEADEVKVDGCGVFEGMLTRAEDEARTGESWIDTQVEESDKSNEF